MPPLDYDRAAAITQTLHKNLVENLDISTDVDRRTVLKGLGGLAAAGGAVAGTSIPAGAASDHDELEEYGFTEHGNFGDVGEYRDLDFDPHEFLTAFNTGRSGQDIVEQEVYEEQVYGERRTVRHFQFTAVDTKITVAPGVEFLAWAYNGQVPGPTIRAVEGDLIRVTFNNLGAHAHTIHPHVKNIDSAMDGVPATGPGVLDAEDDPFTYEWIAQPAGCHLYHCHSLPLKAHIHRGLYGMIIVDPDPERVAQNPEEYCRFHRSQITDELRGELVAEAKTRNHEYTENDAINEMVIVMNGFDTNFDGDNEIYAANTRAFAYMVDSDGEGNWEPGETFHPITIDRTQRQRVYLMNPLEFDLINSFHSHSQFFEYYDHGTTLLPTHKNIDTVMQCQAQRGIIELDYSDHQPGLYMFHAHQSEFAELGWMSFFEVV